jgi:hypothetical protein
VLLVEMGHTHTTLVVATALPDSSSSSLPAAPLEVKGVEYLPHLGAYSFDLAIFSHLKALLAQKHNCQVSVIFGCKSCLFNCLVITTRSNLVRRED